MPLHPLNADAPLVPSQPYEIRIRGRLGKGVLATFEGFEAEVEPVQTVLRGPVADQAALHGLLAQIERLGLELVEVRRVEGPPGAAGDRRPSS
jgi:hypothetical protein